MSNTYRCSAEALERNTDALLKRTLAFQTALMLIPLFIMLATVQSSQPKVFWTIIIFWGMFWAFLMFRVIRRVRKLTRNAASTFELTIDDLQITKVMKDSPSVTIPRSAVQKIHERAGLGFRIETSDSKLNIWVPQELDGYDEVKTMLLASTAAPIKTTKNPLMVMYAWSAMGVVAFLLVFYNQNRIIVTLAGSGLIGFFAWYLVYTQRVSANLSRSVKRSRWVVLLPAAGVIARVLMVWR